ncbi:MAG TPA: hypothetical protein VHZ97_00945 [Pseudonocardiaceae bacterium]|jgi:uncharacterized protein YukE|nr:hypothetical protein [Pseudonocardiaceae bacterium]
MFAFPNSSAMDIAAAGGGPITMLPQIITGQPEQIAAHSSSLLAKAAQFASLMEEFTKAGQSLSQVWSGAASETAVKKITDSLSALQNIIKAVEGGAALLGISGAMVKSAQTAYTSVVSAVNPTVAGLISNPWTYSAGVALATSTSAALRAFITAVEGLLTALGGGKLAAEIATVVSIITQIEQLAAGPNAAATSGATPTTSTVSTPAITMPQAPPPVATSAGQQAITGYTPPALSGYPGNTPTAPTTISQGGTPSIDPSDSWIAVNPPTTPPATTPTVAPSGTGQDVSVTTTDNGITTTVSVPAGQAADINLDTTINGDHIAENLNIGADGSVSVS